VIRRSPKPDRWTSIDRLPIRDERLSFRALGILVHLLDKPDDWRCRAADLSRGEGREGREAVRTALNELGTVGYLQRHKCQNELGQWMQDTIVSELPDPADQGIRGEAPGQTKDGFPGLGSPGLGSLGPIRTTEKNDIEEEDRDNTSTGVDGDPFESASVVERHLWRGEDALPRGSDSGSADIDARASLHAHPNREHYFMLARAEDFGDMPKMRTKVRSWLATVLLENDFTISDLQNAILDDAELPHMTERQAVDRLLESVGLYGSYEVFRESMYG
jgi:hypothetical protein